jgi:predicted amidophosphoribosyltransferase
MGETQHRVRAASTCAACGRPCRPEAVICTRCARCLIAAEPLLGNGPAGLDRVWSSASHEAVARNLVAALRVRHLLPVASLMAERIEWLAPVHMLSGTIVPVPALRRRGRGRTFEPALEIARDLAERLDSPLDNCLEWRPDRSTPARREWPQPPRFRAIGAAPRSALLIADLVDAGATLTACARALRAAGASRVVALTFARRY